MHKTAETNFRLSFMRLAFCDSTKSVNAKFGINHYSISTSLESNQQVE